METECNLLFGALALQTAFLTNDQFAAVCAEWTTRRQTPLADLLVERGWLTTEEVKEVERAVERHLKKHRGDVRQSLAVVADAGVRDLIRGVEDPELRQSLCSLPPAAGYVLVETIDQPVERRSRYSIQRLHGQGGLGRVYVARDTDLHRDVALKEIRSGKHASAEVARRFLKEAQITGQLEHPNIVPVYELARRPEDDQPFYTMRLIRGQTLREAIADCRRRRKQGRADPLDLPRLLGSFVSVCHALAYAHSRGVVHRDIKPENVVLGGFGEVVVLDWGLAKMVDRPDESADPVPMSISVNTATEATQTGRLIGTPAYMAPEQAEGRLDWIDARTDVYGLGATLFEILTGSPPHVGRDTAALLSAIVSGETPRARTFDSTIARPLDAICAKAMAKARDQRYADASQLADNVERFLADEPVSAYRDPPLDRLVRWGRKNRTFVASSVALLVTAVVALSVGLVLLGREEARTERAREEARDHFRRSRDVVDRMLFRFADAPDGLRDVPGLTALRRQIIEEALGYYQEFLHADSIDPDVRHEAGRAFMLRAGARRLDGDHRAAEADLLQAKTLFADLAAEFPSDGAYRLDLARAQTRLGSLYQALNRFAEATDEYRAAVVESQRLADETPADPAPRYQLASAHSNLGTALREIGELGAAETEYRAALALAQQIAQQPGAPPEHRSALGHVHNNLGNLYRQRTEWRQALTELDAAVETWRGLADEFPKVSEYRSLLATAEGNHISPLKELNRSADALRAAETSLTLRQRLAADFPTIPGYQADLATAHFNRATALRDSGRRDEAETAFQEAVSARQKLVRDLPHLPEHRVQLATALITLAQLRADKRFVKEAENGLRAGVAELRAVVADHGSVLPHRARLADAYNNLASFLINNDRSAEAEQPLNDAIDLWRGLVREAPKEATYHSDLGMSLGNLSVVRSSRNDLAGARGILDEAVACHERALALAPQHTDHRARAAREYARVADVALRQGDHAAAVAAADKLPAVSADRADAFFTLACACSRAIAAAEKDPALSEERRGALVQAYTDRAVASLKETRKSKPLIGIRAMIEQDLAPLRKRVDLNAVLGAEAR